MTDATWLSAAKVAALIGSANDETAALQEIDGGIELRTIQGRYAKRIAVRSKGGRQALDAGVITPKLWARVRATYAPADIWSRAEWRLPASATDPETILGGVELNERQVRSALALHGVPDLPPPPKPKPPRKRSGGHHMGAHGAVISSLVIDMLDMPLHEVRAYTEATLAESLADRFKAFDANREHISIENRKRMARHILANVIRKLELAPDPDMLAVK